MKKYLLIPGFLAVAILAQAQDYIILAKGDTVKGVIKILSFDLIDKIQVSGARKETFTAFQVRSLSIQSETYKPVKYEQSIRFMKVMKAGYLSLLSFKPTGTGSWDGRYLLKMDGNGMEVPNLTFKKSMSKFLSDCPALTEKLEKGEFGKREVEKIIDLYNTCVQTKSEERMSSRETAPPATENLNSLEKATAVKKLIEKVDVGDFLSKEDASDLLKDVLKKVEKGEKVPNYLTEGLKSYLGKTPLSGELDSLLELLKK
jgi:hypothetical protein